MSSRYDFVQDPRERRWIARWQAASVMAFIALLLAMMAFGPTRDEAVARNGHASAPVAAPDGPAIARADGA